MKRIYLDYAATTPVDPAVIKAMKPYFSDNFGNPGSLHSFGQAASRAVFLARRGIAEAIGADYQEIIFTGSATEANNLALRGAIAAQRRPRIIVSAVEHESVLETAKDLEGQGVEVIYLPVSREGFIDLDKLRKNLNEHTVLVSIMYANNEIGTIQPISEISAVIGNFRNGISNFSAKGGSASGGQFPISKQKSNYQLPITNYPLFHTDAVQALQYLDCGVNNLGADLMTLSAHKIYGPKGIGALYIRNQELGIRNHGKGNKNPPIIHNSRFIIHPEITGGGQEQNLRSGTENVPYIVGFAKAVELAVRKRSKETVRIKKLRDHFFKNLKKIYPQSDLNGPPLEGKRLPNNLNAYFKGIPANEFLIKLDLAGIAASTGSACSSRVAEPSHVLEALGFTRERLRSSVRFTLGRGTTKAEIDKSLKVIKNLL